MSASRNSCTTGNASNETHPCVRLKHTARSYSPVVLRYLWLHNIFTRHEISQLHQAPSLFKLTLYCDVTRVLLLAAAHRLWQRGALERLFSFHVTNVFKPAKRPNKGVSA